MKVLKVCIVAKYGKIDVSNNGMRYDGILKLSGG